MINNFSVLLSPTAKLLPAIQDVENWDKIAVYAALSFFSENSRHTVQHGTKVVNKPHTHTQTQHKSSMADAIDRV